MPCPAVFGRDLFWLCAKKMKIKMICATSYEKIGAVNLSRYFHMSIAESETNGHVPRLSLSTVLDAQFVPDSVQEDAMAQDDEPQAAEVPKGMVSNVKVELLALLSCSLSTIIATDQPLSSVATPARTTIARSVSTRSTGREIENTIRPQNFNRHSIHATVLQVSKGDCSRSVAS